MATLSVPDVVPPPDQDCQTLKKAFQGWGTDEKAIILVLGQRNASQRKSIRDTYQQLYNESLIDALKSELSGDFLKAVIMWTKDPPERDAELARNALNSRKKGINDLQVIVEIACASSPHHLMADIASCGNGDLESLLKVVIWCIDSPEKHFAEVIKNSVVGFGTDEDSLTRAIVTRAEIDTMKIREEYFNMYKTKLDAAVTGDTSGDYRKFLMTLLGARM